MSVHEQAIGATDEWYTPPYIFDALGCVFDLDVAHPGAGYAEWVPARDRITRDSLAEDWRGFVWMNPPFGGRNGLEPWLAKFFAHGNGIALAPDRTSAPWLQAHAWKADAILFVAPKIKFIGRNGKPGASPAQGTCLFAIGAPAVQGCSRAASRGVGLLMTPALREPCNSERNERLGFAQSVEESARLGFAQSECAAPLRGAPR